MLKSRLLTAAVLLPLVIFGILYTGAAYFAVSVAIVSAIAAWEWSSLARIQSLFARSAYVALLLLGCYLIYYTPMVNTYAHWGVMVTAGLWVLLAVFIMNDPVRLLSSLNHAAYTLLSALAGILLLLAMWWAFVQVHALANGPGLLLGMFALVWAADTGAYFAGRKWGRHKLAPRVSPGKTWEGVAGGLLLALVVALVSPYILKLTTISMPAYLLIAALTVIMSIYGDLLESVFKRVRGVKDSGLILPGHGGILDRLDSIIAAAPMYLTGLLLLGKAA